MNAQSSSPTAKKQKVVHKRFYREAEGVVGRKIKELEDRQRCRTCWHPKHLYCICSHVKKLDYSKNVEFIVYMHYLEFANAGDDAKLLMCCSPERTKLYLYGVEQDDVKMRNHINAFRARGHAEHFGVVLLFPGPKAITIDTFLEDRSRSLTLLASQEVPAENVTSALGAVRDASSLPLLVIVMDATWRRARRMANHFRRHISPSVPHIQLRPTTASVYARTQSENGRICTIEALALLLQEYGESRAVCDKLISYVVLNNKALKCEFINESQILWEPKGAHPAWYYGRRLNAEGDVTSNILDAARNGEEDAVRALLDSGVDPETKNKHGWTALHKAALKGHLSIVQLLCENGATNLNLQTSDGTTPLMCACWKNKVDVLRYLLARNCDCMIRNHKGKTAREVGLGKNHKACVDIIESHMQ
jgi:DTW domain-containing protein YfiP|eukprot:g1003.t1